MLQKVIAKHDRVDNRCDGQDAFGVSARPLSIESRGLGYRVKYRARVAVQPRTSDPGQERPIRILDILEDHRGPDTVDHARPIEHLACLRVQLGHAKLDPTIRQIDT